MRKTKPRFQLGFQPGIQLGSNLGSRLGIQLGFQPGIQTTGRNPAGIQTWDPAGIQTWDPAGIQTWDPAGIQTSDPAGIPSWDTAGNQTQGLSQTPTDSCSPLNWSKLGQVCSVPLLVAFRPLVACLPRRPYPVSPGPGSYRSLLWYR